LGYWFQINNGNFSDRRTELVGIVLGGIIRALCGLCFGVVAYLISDKLKKRVNTKSGMIVVTALEIFCWGNFFFVSIVLADEKAGYSVLFLLPVAVGIAFSQKSYIFRLFRFKWMRFFAPASLAIYLNQWAARYAVTKIFPNCSYKFAVAMMAALTLVNCLLYFIIMKLCKILWHKKLKNIFSIQEEA
jgi:peptidoglycan/LPS O-acetylase OafA/YrhL